MSMQKHKFERRASRKWTLNHQLAASSSTFQMVQSVLAAFKPIELDLTYLNPLNWI